MPIIAMILVLLLAVVISSVVARLLPLRLPLPLIQIVSGAILSAFTRFDVPLAPHVFFLLFIPPLLFLDGWRIPKDSLFCDLRPILTLATGLVFLTVVAIGPLIHWLVPSIPLAVAFALAAILSPTDPVAVSEIASGAPIPSRLMHIIEGESLLNDASGLVCFRFAVAAALTGTFSLARAAGTFALVAGGGVIVGIVVAGAIGLVDRTLVRHTGEEPGVEILVSLLTPFAAYGAAERVHASGILAAAAAGIATHYVDLVGRSLPNTRLRRRAVWDTVQLALNGTMFVLLGQQLPGAAADGIRIAAGRGVGNAPRLFGYVVVVTLAMTAVRFAWVWTSMRLTLFRKQPAESRHRYSCLPLLAAFAGIRGAITLAGILTLPLTMPDGVPLPGRGASISIAIGVILLSLILASVALPLLASRLQFEPDPAPQPNDQAAQARVAAAEAALRRIGQLQKESSELQEHPEQVERVADVYRRRLAFGQEQDGDSRQGGRAADVDRRLRIEALRAERDELDRLRLARQLDDTVHRDLVRQIDLAEAGISKPT